MIFTQRGRPISKNLFILEGFRIISVDSSVQVGSFLVYHCGNLATGAWIQEGCTLQPAGTEANRHQPPFFWKASAPYRAPRSVASHLMPDARAAPTTKQAADRTTSQSEKIPRSKYKQTGPPGRLHAAIQWRQKFEGEGPCVTGSMRCGWQRPQCLARAMSSSHRL